MKCGMHHQNRANTAGSYYKGKPGPEDQAPRSLSMGNRGSILHSRLHAGTHKLLEGGRKNPKQPVLCPSGFSGTGLQQGQPHSHSHEWRSDKAEHFHNTSPPLRTRRKVAHHHSASLAHKCEGTPGFYPGTARGVNTDDKDPLLEWLPFNESFLLKLGPDINYVQSLGYSEDGINCMAVHWQIPAW